MAVIMKLEEVLRMETWVVEVPRARALVKRAHIMPLKIKFRPKNIARITTSTAFSPDPKPKRFAMEVAKVVVSSVVVSFAKTPLKAAQAPLARARIIHWDLRLSCEMSMSAGSS